MTDFAWKSVGRVPRARQYSTAEYMDHVVMILAHLAILIVRLHNTNTAPPILHLHVLQHVAQARPHLLSTWLNLRSRQDESIVARVPQFDSHAVRGLRILVCIVHTVAADLVDRIADRSTFKDGAVHSFHSSDGAISQRLVLRGSRESAGASVAVRVHPELGVRVDVHVQLNTLSSSYAVELGSESFGLDTVTGRGSLVVFSARRGTGTLALVPVSDPWNLRTKSVKCHRKGDMGKKV